MVQPFGGPDDAVAWGDDVGETGWLAVGEGVGMPDVADAVSAGVEVVGGAEGDPDVAVPQAASKAPVTARASQVRLPPIGRSLAPPRGPQEGRFGVVPS